MITGGGSGIGRAAALRLADEGAAVFVGGRRQSALDETIDAVRRSGGRGERLSVDLSEPDGDARLVDAAAAWAGDSMQSFRAPARSRAHRSPTSATATGTLAINLTAPMRIARAATPHLARQGGVVVAVSSINAYLGDLLSQCAHYSAAKAGLVDSTTTRGRARSAADPRGRSGARRRRHPDARRLERRPRRHGRVAGAVRRPPPSRRRRKSPR